MSRREQLPELFLINSWFRGLVKISHKFILIKSNNMRKKVHLVCMLFRYSLLISFHGSNFSMGTQEGLVKMGNQPFCGLLGLLNQTPRLLIISQRRIVD